MLPTLRIGGAFVVQTGATVTDGAIIVFHPPSGADAQSPVCGNPDQGPGHAAACDSSTGGESSQTDVKRVIGSSGERISMRDGVVYRDGVKLNEPYAEPCVIGDLCNFPQTITIPPGEYFVLGDNRPLSADSRFWGPVPAAHIIGTVIACQPATPYCTRG
jgi:signal peptidase I